MKKNILILIAIIISSIIIRAAIILSNSGAPDYKNNNTDKFIYRNATVEDIRIIVLESFPVQINVNITGYLSDSCTKIDRITKEKEGDTFLVTITTIRPADAICTQVIVPFQEVIPLDIYGLKAGTYNVNVNGVKGTFELRRDNIPSDYQNNSTYGNTTAGISKEIKLNIGDNGSQIKLNKGQMLVITLEANPTTGYTWEIAELDTHILHQIGETEFKPESDLPGAGGMQTLRFEAENTGQTPLKLIYHRPWEKDVEPLLTFHIQAAVS